MTTLVEGQHSDEFLLSEGNGTISREQVTIAAAAGAMVPGTLLGKITASSKYVAYNDAAVDGSQTAVGIVRAAVPDLTVDQKAVMYARYCEVVAAQLTGLDTNGRADLLALGIILR